MAILKIQKKAARRLGEPKQPTSLLTLAFCQSLVGSSLYVETERRCRDFEDESEGVCCPVCLEPVVKADAGHLTCGHTFCWGCLANCAAAGVAVCPLCREVQSLDPAQMQIESLLGDGADAAKYSPALRLKESPQASGVEELTSGLKTTPPKGSEEGAAAGNKGPAAGKVAAADKGHGGDAALPEEQKPQEGPRLVRPLAVHALGTPCARSVAAQRECSAAPP